MARLESHCSEGSICCDFLRENARRSGDDGPEVTISDESSPMVLACVSDVGPDCVSCTTLVGNQASTHQSCSFGA